MGKDDGVPQKTTKELTANFVLCRSPVSAAKRGRVLYLRPLNSSRVIFHRHRNKRKIPWVSMLAERSISYFESLARRDPSGIHLRMMLRHSLQGQGTSRKPIIA
jgi:hypothetical protein